MNITKEISSSVKWFSFLLHSHIKVKLSPGHRAAVELAAPFAEDGADGGDVHGYGRLHFKVRLVTSLSLEPFNNTYKYNIIIQVCSFLNYDFKV